MAIRVRFAPSPTGQVHIGNIRTAIFNWLLARHEGGTFLLRIEDTDRERSTPEAIEALLDVMGWLGLDFDETPLYQSAQRDAHVAAAERLIAAGHAYRYAKGEGEMATLFRIPLDLASVPFARPAEMTTIELCPEEPLVIDASGVSYAVTSKKGKPMGQASCLAGMRDLVVTAADGRVVRLADSIEAVLAGERIEVARPVSMTFQRWLVVYRDSIKGELAKPIDGLKDFIIVRSDGNPVFHLANVCDDVAQGITHIIRGDDHVENTYRHLFLFHALGQTPPVYGHLPMIVNQQGKPYSKRDGDAYVGDFRTKGYLSEALFNYLTLLGWAPGDDREKMSRAELVAAFSLDRVGSAPAQMDLAKLENLNGKYLADMPAEDFVGLARAHAAGQPWFAAADPGVFDTVARLMQSRTKLLSRVGEWGYFFTDELAFDADEVSRSLDKPGIRDALRLLRDLLATCEFTESEVEGAIHSTTAASGIKQGKLNLPLRIAITGTTIGAGLYEIMVVLGKRRTLARLDHAIDHLCVS